MVGREPPWVCRERGNHGGKRASLGYVKEGTMVGREPPWVWEGRRTMVGREPPWVWRWEGGRVVSLHTPGGGRVY